MRTQLIRIAAAFLLFCTLAGTAAAQMKLVGEANTDSFPVISLKVHHRDPSGKQGEILELEDGDKVVEFKLDQQVPDDSGRSKSVLILWEYLPATARDAQNKYFRQVLQQALPEVIGEGDAVNVATFAWTDQKTGGEMLTLLRPDFSTDTAGLRQAVAVAKAPGGKGIDAAHGSELYPALDAAIDLLAGEKGAKVIIVLSAEFPNIFNPRPDESSVQAKALKNDVAIYNIRYKLMADKYNLDALAANTYGQSAVADPKNVKSSVAALLNFSDEAIKRSLGMDYAITFTTESARDGKTHPLQITAGQDNLSAVYQAPSQGVGGWIKANLVLFIVLIVVLLGAAVGLALWLRKRGKDEAARRAAEERKIQEVESQGKATEDRLAQQRNQLDRMQSEEAERKRRAEEAKRQEEIERETKQLLGEMYANGKQPRLTTIVNGAPITMELPSPVTTVGRDAGCDVKIADPTISRTHFQVIYNGGKYTLLDLGSTNGTLLNGERAHQVELRHGDQIKAGEAILFFYI